MLEEKRVELFIDTANIEEIREIASWGVIRGVTTNPKIFAKEGVGLRDRIQEILQCVNGPLSVEVTTNDYEEMIKEAKQYASWHDNIVVKVPMSPVGLRAATELKKKNIKTNVTAVMSVNQAILAAMAGATYTSIFMSRIADIGHDPLDVIRKSVEIFDRNRFETKIIIGSIRLMTQINEAASAGAHVITVPYAFFKQLASHPLTDSTINEFLKAWSKVPS